MKEPDPTNDLITGVEMCCFYCHIVPAVRGKYQGFVTFVLYRQKRQCNENINRQRGKPAVVLPVDCPRSVGVIAGD